MPLETGNAHASNFNANNDDVLGKILHFKTVNVQIQSWNLKGRGVEINNIDCFTASLAAYKETRLNNRSQWGIESVHLITLIQQLHAHMNIYTGSVEKNWYLPSSYPHY